jgi:hypothetical protein
MTRTQKTLARSVGGLVGAILLCCGTRAGPPADGDKSLEPATSGVEIDVYEAVLHSWFGGLDSNVEVDEHLDSAPALSDKGVPNCLDGIDFRPDPLPALDSLRGATFRRKGVRVVATWYAKHQRPRAAAVRDEFHDTGPQQAFALSTFSHIQFDQDRRLALLTFSYVCGNLCGSGSTLLMKKSANGWKVLKRCLEWQY